MQDNFFEFYPPKEAVVQSLWDDGLLVPDTNTLFHLFRFSAERSAQVFAAFDWFGDRLRLPYQVRFEFHGGWRQAETDARDVYANLKKKLKQQADATKADFKEFRRMRDLPDASPAMKIGEFFEALRSQVDEALRALTPAKDIMLRIDELFAGKTCDRLPNWSELIEEAWKRRSRETPPGFNDSGPGDFLIWSEMKALAKSNQKPVLFITDDGKDDWWWLSKEGRNEGPLPALRREFFDETGQQFYAYSPSNFLKLIGARNVGMVSSETVDQMKEAEQAISFHLASGASQTLKLARLAEALASETGVERAAILNSAILAGECVLNLMILHDQHGTSAHQQQAWGVQMRELNGLIEGSGFLLEGRSRTAYEQLATLIARRMRIDNGITAHDEVARAIRMKLPEQQVDLADHETDPADMSSFSLRSGGYSPGRLT